MSGWIGSVDEFGPEKVLHVYDHKVGMKGVVVIDSTTLGITGGGCRMLPDISTKEVYAIARAMTYKFSILDLPVGGSKAGIWADPCIEGERRTEVLNSFGNAIKPLLENGLTIAADIGIDETDVTAIYQGAGIPLQSRVLSLQEIDGELVENHATGYGVVVAAKAACEFAGFELKGSHVAIEGFGKIGGAVARYMMEAGAKIVALSTIRGTLYNEEGLDVEELLSLRKKFGDGVVSEYGNARHMKKAEIYYLPVDVLVPGARPHVIDHNNAHVIQAKVISSVANLPITDGGEEILFQRGIWSVPDFVSNAGRAVVEIVDILGGSVDNVFAALQNLLGSLAGDIFAEARGKGMNPRSIAVNKAKDNIRGRRTSKEPAPSFEEVLQGARERLGI